MYLFCVNLDEALWVGHRGKDLRDEWSLAEIFEQGKALPSAPDLWLLTCGHGPGCVYTLVEHGFIRRARV